MSEVDRRQWDDRHADTGVLNRDPGPPRLFAPHLELFPTDGRALEIACGTGETAVWLARRGMEVHAVDVSPVAVRMAEELAHLNDLSDRSVFAVWDLDQGLPPGPLVDLLVCHMFRDPRLYPTMAGRLAPGGLLAVAGLSEVGAGPGRFRSKPGELRDAFAALEIVAEGEGDEVTWLLGRESDRGAGVVPR